MHLIRSKVEQLVDHLRGSIERGEVVEPLPNIVAWSEQLGVSHGTLEKAIVILKRQGLIVTRPRKGIHLAGRTAPRPALQQAPVVRWIAYGRRYKDMSTLAEIFGAISERLGARGIRFSLEMCDAVRLKAIHRQGPRAHELLLLPSLPREFQALFNRQKNVLLLGPPFEGIRLPSILTDAMAAIRHATNRLAQRGFQAVSLLVNKGANEPIETMFQPICAAAPRPVRGEVIRVPEELSEQVVAVQRLAARLVPGHALIALSPVPPAMVMMAAMKRGLRVPEQVEVVSVCATSYEIRTLPVPVYYPYPLEKLSKEVADMAVRYFEQGTVPLVQKRILIEMVEPS